jgi:copper chaperone NosL
MTQAHLPATRTAADSHLQPSVSPNTYVVPTAVLMLGAMLLVVSMFLPYWQLTLHAPQYPHGLTAELYVTHLAGDVQEIDGLNHYIGMPKLEEAATFERSFAVVAVVALALLLLAAVFIHNHWAGLLALPALLYPAMFFGDLYFWLNRFGHDLDPKAPLSSSIKPFTPTILGDGKIGQFGTTAILEDGFYLAIAGSVVVLLGLYLHRRAYKPLVDAHHHPTVSEPGSDEAAFTTTSTLP